MTTVANYIQEAMRHAREGSWLCTKQEELYYASPPLKSHASTAEDISLMYEITPYSDIQRGGVPNCETGWYRYQIWGGLCLTQIV